MRNEREAVLIEGSTACHARWPVGRDVLMQLMTQLRVQFMYIGAQASTGIPTEGMQ
jgi:hypothetical protein